MRFHAHRLHTLRAEVRRHRLRALLGNALVHRHRADVVGMTVDLDDGLVVLGDGVRDVVERRIELRLDVGLVEIEGHAVGQVQLDDIAIALHVDTGAGRLPAQLGFLLVLIGADAHAGERADASADHGFLATVLGTVAGQHSDHGSDAGADQCILALVVHSAGRIGIILLRRIVVGLLGIGGAAGQHARHNGGDHACLDRKIHPDSPFIGGCQEYPDGSLTPCGRRHFDRHAIVNRSSPADAWRRGHGRAPAHARDGM